MRSFTKKSIVLLLVAVFFMSFAESIYSLVFNNYFKEVHELGAMGRGWLELPRELPGILSLLVIGLLFFLSEIRIAALSAFLVATGVAAISLPICSESLPAVVACVMTASLGYHMMMVVMDAIIIHSVKPENRALRMGQMRALTTGAGLCGSAFVWLKWNYLAERLQLLRNNYAYDFILIGILTLIPFGIYLFLKAPGFPTHGSLKDRFIIKKRYSKFYLLEVLFGTRKQIFITFGFWVIVDVLEKQPDYLGKLVLIGGVIGIFFKPFVGRLIDRFGERRILFVNGILLFIICFGYGFSLKVFERSTATLLISAFFICDSLLFAFTTARRTYMARIAEKKEDITPTLYTGMAIDHAVSISTAIAGGYVWKATGSHLWVFLLASVLALISSGVALTIPDRKA